MKKITFTIAILLSFFLCNSQVGIFKTYEDYQNNNVEEFDSYVKCFHVMGKFKVVFTKDGQEEKIEVSLFRMWGYRRGDGRIMRINDQGAPYVYIVEGDISIYANYSTKFDKRGNAKITSQAFAPLLSEGPDGSMIILKKKNVLKMLEGDQTWWAKAKKTCPTFQCLVDFALEYNKRNGDSAKKDPSLK